MAKAYLDNDTWRYFWHPVCTKKELDESDDGRGKLLRALLLGQELVIAELDNGMVAMDNRCPHRSAKLHLGWNCGNAVQCPYHGWKWGVDGKCLEVPAAPDGRIPSRAINKTFECQEKYGLVWVRLDGAAKTTIPRHIAMEDPTFTCTLGPTYDWQTHSARRVENYTDLAHFPFVHPETLGVSGQTKFLVPDIRFRSEGRMRFRYDPPKGARKSMDATGNLAELLYTDYTVQLPFGVTLDQPLGNDTRTVMWMYATPLDDVTWRTFWFACNTSKETVDPTKAIEPQMAILEEDVQVVESQDPRQIPHPRDEIAVPADKVSLTYRRLLYDMCEAKAIGPEALHKMLIMDRDDI